MTAFPPEEPTGGRGGRKRGGGPPGGSAYDSEGRLRRISATRAEQWLAEPEADHADAQIVMTPFGAADGDDEDPGAPRGHNDDLTGRDGNTRADDEWLGSLRSAPVPEAPAPPTTARRFPGGRVSLPRLDRDDGDGTEVSFVGTAFVRGAATATRTEPRPLSSFEEYFTFESLFDEDAEADEADPVAEAYRVLGVDATTPWPEVICAHRTLAKKFHPDCFTGMDESAVAEAEATMVAINQAYQILVRLRRAASGDADQSLDDDPIGEHAPEPDVADGDSKDNATDDATDDATEA